MSLEEEMQAALATLLVEAVELLEEMESGLLALEQGDDSGEVVNSVFRAVHTIKGSSGLFGLDGVVQFTHVVESVLDRVRGRELAVSADLVGALLPCKDHICDLLDNVAQGIEAESKAQARHGAALVATLAPYLDPVSEPADDLLTDAERPADSDNDSRMHLSLRFGPDTLRSGMDPLSFLRYLATLGEVQSVTTVTDLLPEADDMDAETCYVSFEVTFDTTATVEMVSEVFEFVREESDIRILTAASPRSDFTDLVESYGVHGPLVTEALVRSRLVRGSDARTGTRGTTPGSPLGAADDDHEDEHEDEPACSAPTGAAGRPIGSRVDGSGKDSRTIRVDASRLDRLIDTVGELVIAGAGAGLSAMLNADESVRMAVDEVTRLIEGVRDDALRLRMVPIGSTFSRFQRVVRDVSASLGKDVSLVISGGDTEVDKALVEQIGDPLMHLVRNALDHGIESPEVRAADGKPARGTLQLRASHDSGSILVEIEDDGGGIDLERVREKAIERGLVEPGARLSDKETSALIFEPGFSTASAVSALSGRGVGMDVVKRNVTALRGTIDLDSTPGQGTTIRIRLPLTLAIIDGFMVGVGPTTFIVPLDRVLECVELPATSRHRNYLDLRGEVLPLIRLRALLSVPGQTARRESVVVVEDAGIRTGLVVDALMGEFQTVIKPLGPMFANVQGVGGSTILGNGDVALIIDVPLLVRLAVAQAGLEDGRLVGQRTA